MVSLVFLWENDLHMVCFPGIFLGMFTDDVGLHGRVVP
jgi:hypothetical protein